jgi:hypothetical protein
VFTPRSSGWELKYIPFPGSLGFLSWMTAPFHVFWAADFLAFAKVRIDSSARRYCFLFQPEREFKIESLYFDKGNSQEFPCSCGALEELLCGSISSGSENSAELAKLTRSFPSLFSDRLGSVKGMVCHLDLSDNVPVRSRPYQCSPPRFQALRDFIQDLVEKGLVNKSYSQYASPAFLVPKPGGGSRMVVDYRLLNKKVVFDAFPMPNIECAFANFSKAKIYSVLDRNSAYYQIPFSAKSRKATAFCTPFGLFEYTKLPMGISVGCQVLSRVVDSFFGDLKHRFVYNFMDDWVLYSSSFEEHLGHLRKVFSRLEKAGFNLNREKLRLTQEEIPFLGHLVSGQGIRYCPNEWRPSDSSLPLRTLGPFVDF